MAAKINIKATEIWKYFQGCKEELKTLMHLIAENPDYGVQIYITSEKELPNIVVTADDVPVYEEVSVNEHDCTKTAEKVFDTYLTEKAIMVLSGLFDDEDYPTTAEIEDMISEREDALDCAIYNFVTTVMMDENYDVTCAGFDEILDDIKEHILEYMARKHKLPIYRPMVLEYDDGTEEVSDYPYDDMEFDDPDNPIYK